MVRPRRSAVAFRNAGLRVAALAIALRAVGVLVLAVVVGGAHAAHSRLVRWDADWYAGIAANGYGVTRVLPDGRRLSDEAFFPLYPMLERGVHDLTTLSIRDAGLLISAVSVVAAAYGVFAVGSLLAGRRAGVVLAAIWVALPTAVVLSMAYSEALFVALCAWSLYALVRQRLLVAAGLAVLAGLTRPVGVAVVAAVMVAAVVQVWQARRDTGQVAVRPLVAAALAPMGWLGYVGVVGWWHRDPFGYLAVQDGWGNGFDGGRAFGAWIVQHLSDTAHPWQRVVGVALAAGVLVVLSLFVVCLRDRQPVPILVYSGVLVVFALTTSRYFGSKPRYLLPAFPLLLPIAMRLTSLRTRRWLTRRSLPPPLIVSLVALPLVGAAAVGGALTLSGSGPP